MPAHFALHLDYQSQWLAHYARASALGPPRSVYTEDRRVHLSDHGGVVWLFTLMPGPPPGPALCGRLVLAGGRVNVPGKVGFDPRFLGARHAIDINPGASELIRPIACALLATIPGLDTTPNAATLLDDPSAFALESFWSRAPRHPPVMMPSSA